MYFNTPRFYRKLTFMDQADIFLWLLSFQFDFVIVSFGNPANLKLKKIWIDKKLKLFINDSKMLNQSETKFIGLDFADYKDKSCVDMSDGIFVDDTYEYLMNSNAKHKIVFGKQYPWNANNESSDDARPNVRYTRCKNWMELYQEIMNIYNLKVTDDREELNE